MKNFFGTLITWKQLFTLIVILSLTFVGSEVMGEIAFEETTTRSGISIVNQTYGSAWGDFNGDGWQDLWIGHHFLEPNLYLNNKDGTFTEVTEQVGLGNLFDSDLHGSSWVDFNNDGFLDLLIIVGAEKGLGSGPNLFFVNDNGNFQNKAAEYELEYSLGRGRAPLWFDWDNDGLLDLIITNLPRPDGEYPTAFFQQTSNGFENFTPLHGFGIARYIGFMQIPFNLQTNITSLSDNSWNGKIDEVRISHSVRSNDWIKYEYKNQKDPSSFYSIGAEEMSPSSPWFDANWQLRKEITINSSRVSSDLTEFPMLVSITDAELGASAQPNGDDILFTLSDGITKLSHEIESWNDRPNKLEAWVKVPKLSSSSDTKIFMYYGNQEALNQEDVEKTWNINYKAVYHLNDNFLDSTRNNFDLTNTGSTNTKGIIGDGLNFDGVNDSLFVSGFPFSSEFTISGWVNTRDISGNSYRTWLSKGGINEDDTNFSAYMRHRPSDDCTLLASSYDNSGSNSLVSYCPDEILQKFTDSWRYVTITLNATDKNFKLFVDGKKVRSDTENILPGNGNQNLRIGMSEINNLFYVTPYEEGIYNLSQLSGTRILEDLNVRKPQAIDLAIEDFNGDLLSDIFITRSELDTYFFKKDTTNLLSRLLLRDSGEQEIRFQSFGPLEFDFFHGIVDFNTTDIFIGSEGINPESFSFSISPGDREVWGILDHIPGVDKGFYIGYDLDTKFWNIKHSSPDRSKFQFEINSKNSILEIETKGAESDNLFMNDQLLIQSESVFMDVTSENGFSSPTACRSIGTGDFDNDMDIDIYLVCSISTVNIPNILYENIGNGNFVIIENSGGAAGSNLGIGDAVSIVDFDNDGFLDLFVTNGEHGQNFPNIGPSQLFKNVGNENHWLEIDLEGTISNRDGIGSRVFVTTDNISQVREQKGGLHYRSQDSQIIHFGLGQHEQVDSITVHWPSGIIQEMKNILADQIITIVEQQSIDSLKHQTSIGIEPTEIKCRNDLVLILKISTNEPACVKSTSVNKLIDRNWGISIN